MDWKNGQSWVGIKTHMGYVCMYNQEAYGAEGRAGHHHRDPVVGTQGGPRKREGRRMGQTRGGGARCPRGGMARILGPAAPQIPRTP